MKLLFTSLIAIILTTNSANASTSFNWPWQGQEQNLIISDLSQNQWLIEGLNSPEGFTYIYDSQSSVLYIKHQEQNEPENIYHIPFFSIENNRDVYKASRLKTFNQSDDTLWQIKSGNDLCLEIKSDKDLAKKLDLNYVDLRRMELTLNNLFDIEETTACQRSQGFVSLGPVLGMPRMVHHANAKPVNINLSDENVYTKPIDQSQKKQATSLTSLIKSKLLMVQLPLEVQNVFNNLKDKIPENAREKAVKSLIHRFQQGGFSQK